MGDETRSGDEGFTLVELLVVMIVIGILAAVAIPIFLSQRAKARDAATKADVTRVGKEVAAYYVNGTGALTLTTTATTATLERSGTTLVSLPLSLGTVSQSVNFRATSGSEPTTWCVALANPDGATKNYSYSAAAGLAPGTCP